MIKTTYTITLDTNCEVPHGDALELELEVAIANAILRFLEPQQVVGMHVERLLPASGNVAKGGSDAR